MLTFTGYDAIGTISEPMIIAWYQHGDTLEIGGFHTAAVYGTGVLVNLLATIDPGVSVGEVIDLTFQEFIFNEGQPMAYTHDGWIEIVAFYTIEGYINYHMGNLDPIEAVDMNMTGFVTQTVQTDETGYYLFENLQPEYYMVTPKKWDVHASPFIISLSDAVSTAQFAVGMITLTPNQQIAADVSDNGAVQFFDASYIAQYAVGLIDTFAAAANNESDWEFVPEYNEYDPLTGNETDDYDGILYGEVTGNWFSMIAAVNPIVDNSLIGTYEMNEDMVTIPIMVNDISPDVYFLQAEFNFNTEQVEFISVASTDLMSNWVNPNNPSEHNIYVNTNDPGNVRLGAFGTEPLASTGAVFTLTFKVLEPNQVINIQMENYFIQEGSDHYNATIIIGAPTSYALQQNYPNPFNPETIIRYDIKERGYVTLIVYNSLGQKVCTLFDGVRDPNSYVAHFNGTEYSSGIYFYQIKCNDFTDTKKMILVK